MGHCDGRGRRNTILVQDNVVRRLKLAEGIGHLICRETASSRNLLCCRRPAMLEVEGKDEVAYRASAVSHDVEAVVWSSTAAFCRTLYSHIQSKHNEESRRRCRTALRHSRLWMHIQRACVRVGVVKANEMFRVLVSAVLVTL